MMDIFEINKKLKKLGKKYPAIEELKTHKCKICGEQVVLECFDYDECDNNKSSASPAGQIPVKDEGDYYLIEIDGGYFYAQRKHTKSASEKSLSLDEVAIVKLCKHILGT